MADFSRLIVQLNNTGLAVSNNPLYQFLLSLLQTSQAAQAAVSSAIKPSGTTIINNETTIINSEEGDHDDNYIVLPSSGGSGGGLTNAQIAARILIDKRNNSASGGSAGSQGAPGPTGPQGPQGNQGVTGLAGIDGEDGYDGITIPPSQQPLASPTSKVGLAAVNGSALTAMRSDGAPPIDQSIIPTWTGAHTFGANITQTAGVTELFETANFSWNSRTDGTVYGPANTDGFAVITGQNTNSPLNASVIGYTDNSNPPTTARISSGVPGGNGNGIKVGLTMPVKKGDYWEVVCSNVNNISLFWVPLGTNP